jgi:hypothetical protein
MQEKRWVMHDILFAISDAVGILGVIFILTAYYHLSMGIWVAAKSMRFQIMNFVGAWLILFSLYFHWNTASVMIEIAWITISIGGMYRIKNLYGKQAAE